MDRHRQVIENCWPNNTVFVIPREGNDGKGRKESSWSLRRHSVGKKSRLAAAERRRDKVVHNGHGTGNRKMNKGAARAPTAVSPGKWPVKGCLKNSGEGITPDP